MESFLRRLLEESTSEVSQPHPLEVGSARLAIYDNMTSPPRVLDIGAETLDEFIGLLAAKTYESSRERGGDIPYTVIKEVTENLIHAFFKDIVISVLADGNTILVSDQGPGLPNKTAAFQPGYSTASTEMKKYIRGVGSGLPVAHESMSFLGGSIRIDDNLGRGTVVTISLPNKAADPGKAIAEREKAGPKKIVPLSNRQKKVLSLIMEFGRAGPSVLAVELGVSLSTAHREISKLSDLGLLVSDEGGKRSLTAAGVARLGIGK